MRKMSQATTGAVPDTEGPHIRTVIGHVAAILLGNAGNNTAPKSGLSQREMALQIETSWEQVNTSLKYLHDEGAIRIDRHRITIIEPSLRKIAGLASGICQEKPTKGG